ncbi:MAG: arylsulfatase A-like enzyme [Pseudohongiellaceae bacterium]|jgi:arylsulfatase A-like enzyme
MRDQHTASPYVPLSPRGPRGHGPVDSSAERRLKAPSGCPKTRTGRTLAAFGLCALLAACGPEQQSPPVGAAPPRNVVLISIDSLRADHLGSYGYSRNTSPNLDALAQRGVLFETCVAESSWTLPTHASLLTGVSSGAHGLDHDGVSLPEALPTLAERLSDAGWRTRGLWSGPYLHPLFGFGRGYADGDYEGLLPSTRYDTEAFAASGKAPLAPHTEENRLAHQATTAAAVIDKALQFVNEAGDEPFFLFVHLFDVHYDFVAPESSWRPFAPDYDGPMTGLDFATDKAIHEDMPAADLAHLQALYDGEIAFTDAQLGRLLDRLQGPDRAGDTLVIVTSDHGDEFFEHGEKGHRLNLFEEVLDVPLIMAGAGVSATGQRISGVTEHTDVMPTILALLGLPAAEFATGKSLADALSAGELPDDRLAVARLRRSAKRKITAVRGAHWKVVIDQRGPNQPEEVLCFDLSTDPAEQHPLDDDAMLAEARRAIERRDGREAYLRARLGAGAATDLPKSVSDDLQALGYTR